MHMKSLRRLLRQSRKRIFFSKHPSEHGVDKRRRSVFPHGMGQLHRFIYSRISRRAHEEQFANGHAKNVTHHTLLAFYIVGKHIVCPSHMLQGCIYPGRNKGALIFTTMKLLQTEVGIRAIFHNVHKGQ